MKTRTISILVSLCVLFLLISLQTVVAQEMSKEAWEADMKDYTARRTDLQSQLSTVTTEIANLRSQSDKLTADLRSCEDALYAMLGVTRAEVEAFEKELTDMESRVGQLQRMSDAELLNYRDEIERMNNRLKEMAASKIALIPRYGERVNSLQNKVAALMKSLSREKMYTVGTWSRDRDCLWNIAKKKDIYDNAWLWPKIWQGNRDKIKDPDLIKPRWVLKIPEGSELSKQEKAAANSYYRKKASAPGASQ
ncbi:MAG: LysM peptidoglycan-binding domain-containing protein [Ignavibacteriae bacterium]|nr:LysM peptidoglycan-binding domain-containing protein [Ignavibacteriota bacterium]